MKKSCIYMINLMYIIKQSLKQALPYFIVRKKRIFQDFKYNDKNNCKGDLNQNLVDPNFLLFPDYPKLNNFILEIAQHRQGQ